LYSKRWLIAVLLDQPSKPWEETTQGRKYTFQRQFKKLGCSLNILGDFIDYKPKGADNEARQSS